MAIQAQIRPAAWGAAGGAVAAMIIGFVWGGWVTGGTSERAAGVAAQAAVVQNFVPLCVAKSEQQPDQLVLLKKEIVLPTDRFRDQGRMGRQRDGKVPSQCRRTMRLGHS